MERMALVNVEGSGLVGIKGVDKRIFGVLEYHGVNVALISQAVCYLESTLSIFQ
jgi:aspartokinase/homoserine dehydrogenase 1